MDRRRDAPGRSWADVKETEMFAFIDQIRTAARKRAEYDRLVVELSSPEMLWDLNIYHADIHQIAHEAVYGA